MNRGAGTGFMGFGIGLIVLGAIMRFAVTVHTTGFNIHTAGMIVLLVGAGSFLAGVLLLTLGGHQRTTTRDTVVQTPAGQEHVQEQDNWSSL